MPIRVTLDQMLTKRSMTARDLAAAVDITEANLSLLRTGKVRGLRFGTLARICKHLGCQPADLLRYEADAGDDIKDEDAA